MNDAELSPLQRFTAAMMLVVGAVCFTGAAVQHGEIGNVDYNPVAAYKQDHPDQQLPSDLSQMQDASQRQELLAFLDVVAAAGLLVGSSRILSERSVDDDETWY